MPRFTGSVSRSSFYFEGKGESLLNLQLMRVIDEQFLETPYYGSRQMTRHLRRQCCKTLDAPIGTIGDTRKDHAQEASVDAP